MKRYKYIIVLLLLIVVVCIFLIVRKTDNDMKLEYENNESFKYSLNICDDVYGMDLEDCSSEDIISIKTENLENHFYNYSRDEKYILYTDGNTIKIYDVDNKKSINLNLNVEDYYEIGSIDNHYIYLDKVDKDYEILTLYIYDFYTNKMIEMGKYKHKEQCGGDILCYLDELYEGEYPSDNYYYISFNNNTIYDKTFDKLIDNVSLYSTYSNDKIIVFKDNNLMVYNYNNKELKKIKTDKEIVKLTNKYTFYIDNFNIFMISNDDIVENRNNSYDTGVRTKSVDDKRNNIYDIYEYEEATNDDSIKGKELIDIKLIDFDINSNNYKETCKKYNNCDEVAEDFDYYGYEYTYDPSGHKVLNFKFTGMFEK